MLLKLPEELSMTLDGPVDVMVPTVSDLRFIPIQKMQV